MVNDTVPVVPVGDERVWLISLGNDGRSGCINRVAESLALSVGGLRQIVRRCPDVVVELLVL